MEVMKQTTSTVLAAAAALLAVTVTPLNAQQCPGDCDGDELVGVNELVRSVNIALAMAPVETCAAVDTGFDGAVGINELIGATRRALDGCPESRFRFVAFENAADDRPDFVGGDFVEADVCRNLCIDGLPEPYSPTLVDALIQASGEGTTLVTRVDTIYPGSGVPPSRDDTRHLVSARYCSNIDGFPCNGDDDCGVADACVPAPTSIAFTLLDLARKETLADGACGQGIELEESSVLVRIQITDGDQPPIELIAGTTLMTDDFDNCDF